MSGPPGLAVITGAELITMLGSRAGGCDQGLAAGPGWQESGQDLPGVEGV